MARYCWLIALGAAVLLAGCGSASGAQYLPRLSVQPADLPHGMERASSRWWSNRQEARRDGISLATYDQHGRLRSYDVRYDRRGGPVRTYLQHVESEVTAYGSAAGARWAFTRARSAAGRGHMWGSTTLGSWNGLARISVPYKSMRLPAVGSGRAAYSSTWGGDEFAYTTCRAIFWWGRHLVQLQVTAVEGDAAPRWIAALARIIDRRLRRES